MELVLEMNRVSRFIVSEYIIVKSSEVMTIIPGGLFASFRWTVAPPPNARTPGTFQRRWRGRDAKTPFQAQFRHTLRITTTSLYFIGFTIPQNLGDSLMCQLLVTVQLWHVDLLRSPLILSVMPVTPQHLTTLFPSLSTRRFSRCCTAIQFDQAKRPEWIGGRRHRQL